MKFKFTGETKVEYGITLKRIQREDTGEVGGWIEKETNLSVSGNAWVSGDAWVYGNARVSWCSGLRYNITVTPQNVAVGCKLYSHAEVKKITKRQAVLDGLPANQFANFKTIILAMIKEVTR